MTEEVSDVDLGIDVCECRARRRRIDARSGSAAPRCGHPGGRSDAGDNHRTADQPDHRQTAADGGRIDRADSGIELREAGGGWRMYTRARFAPYVERLLLDGARSKLTRAALETLAVVAYRQPVTRARVSAVRGVNCDAVIRTLAARGLIIEAGADSDSGATMFATTELFLERLGLTSLTDLPDIAPLLPDIDVIDDLSESLDSEPRFAKLAG